MSKAQVYTNNPLLVKDTVGKARPTVYDLPSQNHIYGKKVVRNPEECAAQATSKHAIPALDYITMNRNIAKQGFISQKSIRDYRKSHPVRMKIGDDSLANISAVDATGAIITSAEARKLKLLGPFPHDKDPAFTYGMPTRASTPVAYLMTDQFQRDWIKAEEKRNAEKQASDKDRVKMKLTKTTAPLKVALPKKVHLSQRDPKTLFKMSKFTKVGAKVSCRRSSPNESTAKTTTTNVEKKTANNTESNNLADNLNNLKISHVAPAVENSKNGEATGTQDISKNAKPVKEVRFDTDDKSVPQGKSVLEPSPVTNKKIFVPGYAPNNWQPESKEV